MLHRVARGRRKELTDIDKVMTWVNECEEPELEEHYALAHGTLEGEPYPQPCPADGCNAFHGTPAKCLAEKEAEDAEYNRLAAAAELSDKGRDAFNARVLDHAHRHRQVRWNKKGLPLANIPKKRVFVELLHSIFLNAAKLQIKHAWMKYFPDEVRDDAHRLFKAWGIPIDMRPPGKRTDQEKWPGGGTVRFLIYGGNGKCPGFAYVTAKLTFMMAEHELKKKLEREADALAAAAAAAKENSAKDKTKAAAKAIGANLFLKPTSKRSKGPSALPLDLTTPKSKAGSGSAAVEEPKEVETIPLESQERLTTPAQVAAIKARYGPFLGQRVITTLLSGETFRLACVRSKKRLPVPATQSAKDEHAFDWFHDWSDWVEAIERVGDHNFKSWVPHRLIMKAVKCIKERGDLWARSTSALEMNQSDVGRMLDKCSSRRKSIDQGDERTSPNCEDGARRATGKPRRGRGRAANGNGRVCHESDNCDGAECRKAFHRDAGLQGGPGELHPDAGDSPPRARRGGAVDKGARLDEDREANRRRRYDRVFHDQLHGDDGISDAVLSFHRMCT